jgi:hypothetical protein
MALLFQVAVPKPVMANRNRATWMCTGPSTLTGPSICRLLAEEFSHSLGVSPERLSPPETISHTMPVEDLSSSLRQLMRGTHVSRQCCIRSCRNDHGFNTVFRTTCGSSSPSQVSDQRFQVGLPCWWKNLQHKTGPVHPTESPLARPITIQEAEESRRMHHRRYERLVPSQLRQW